VSILMINGTEDRIVPWEGGQVRMGLLKLGKKSAVPETLHRWVIQNKCVGSPEMTLMGDEDPEDGTRIEKTVYSSCEGGSEVVMYTVDGGGHTWPGSVQYMPQRIVGRISQDMAATQVIWEFFRRQPTRAAMGTYPPPLT